MLNRNILSDVLLEDIDKTASDAAIPWNDMKNSVVLITGATGTIGSALARALIAADEKHDLNLRVLGTGRNEKKAEQLLAQHGADFICADICQPLSVDGPIDYIFHCAAVTQSAEMVRNPVNVIESSIIGTRNILQLAAEKRIKSMVYLSSMEVYGVTNLDIVCENDLGTIDLSSPRSSYSESKRVCELLCNCYFSQYALPVKTARLAQTFGAGTPANDSRVFAQFARSAINGKDLILHSQGASRGNYCYLNDAVRALLLLLLKGKSGQAYNISNPSASATIYEMAELVATELSGGKIKVTIDVPENISEYGYAPKVGHRLNADKMMALRWRPEYGLLEMYTRMIENWQTR